jgi:hypothetical protein
VAQETAPRLQATSEKGSFAELRKNAKYLGQGYGGPTGFMMPTINALIGLNGCPGVSMDRWKEEWREELKRSRGGFSEYAEALVVVPRFLGDVEDRTRPQEFAKALHEMGSLTEDPRLRRLICETRLALGDKGAADEAAKLYEETGDEDERSTLLDRIVGTPPGTTAESKALRRVARDNLLKAKNLPLTEDQFKWLAWIQENPDLSLFDAAEHVFTIYAGATAEQIERDSGDIDRVTLALAVANGSRAIPILRRGFTHGNKEFALRCVNAALVVGDPEALKWLVRHVPRRLTETGQGDGLSEAELERFSAIVSLLEPGVLPPYDELWLASGKPLPKEFRERWAHLAEAVEKDTVDLIATPLRFVEWGNRAMATLTCLRFQVVFRE